jgi:hypothetical protein
MQDDNDYGFTMVDDSEQINEISSLTNQIEDLKDRLRKVNKIFMPLLVHLSKDSDKPMIKWPNRKQVIQEQIDKLNELTNI